MTETPPDNPAGSFEPVEAYDETIRTTLIETLRRAPMGLRQSVAELTDSQLNTLYKNRKCEQTAMSNAPFTNGRVH